MRYLTGFFFVLVLALSPCNNADSAAKEKAKQDSIDKMASREKYLKAITNAETEMRNPKNNYDPKLANATLKAYNDFIVTFPNDTATAEYLFLAASLAQGAQNYEQAAVYLETILDKHKDYKKYAIACFAAANLYDDHLENVNHGDDRARQLYQFIITHYPNTKLANDSKVLIQYVGKPDSVLINDVIKKGEKQQ